MARPTKFTESQILDAAAAIIAAAGPAAATMSAIGTAIGAPSGSLYHRFRTRDELLGRLGLEKAAYFQDRFAAALESTADPVEAGLRAALALPRAVRDDFTAARVMLLHRREDFLGEGWPDDMRRVAEQLGRQIEQALSDITKRLFGEASKAGRQTASFALFDVPYAAVRRYVGAGRMPPARVDALIELAYRAVIEGGVGE